jgi:hypothetical protein
MPGSAFDFSATFFSANLPTAHFVFVTAVYLCRVVVNFAARKSNVSNSSEAIVRNPQFVMNSLPSTPRRQRRMVRALSALALAAILVPLTACGPKRMRADFIGFEKAYAETANREVLLNLARLQNHDTTYFFKLGQISSAYRMVASLTGNGNYVIQGTGVGGNATGGGTPLMSFENDPSFTFIPVNDDVSAQLLLKPIPAGTLYNLFLQGWRIDQLFRLMVDRVELSSRTPDGKSCAVQTLRNVPPPVPTASTGTDADYLADAAGYASFLRVAAIAYGLQKHGHLLLKGATTWVPFDALSPVAGAESAAPKASDMAAAAAKSQSWEFDATQNKWLLGQQVFGAQFYLNDADNTAKQTIQSDSRLAGLDNGDSLDNILYILQSGFSIDDAHSGASNEPSCPQKGVSAHLVMRSLLGLMSAVAQEQAAFDALAANNTVLPLLDKSKKEQPRTFTNLVPPIERMPAIRLKWAAGDKNGPPLVAVNYAGTNYLIADSTDPQLSENRYWNRDMFRLLNQLTAQVTVDISKFPLPGILNVHPN